ncbi:MAG TPA: DUF481 domain-containing protein [Planctomycetota bacterium]|nr:DUF481 domain-containing protein [Planctomycetota bacterium]
MRNLLNAAMLTGMLSCAMAQDRITLANGDVLTGTIKSMADGKVTIASPVLGDVTVPMSSVSDLVTQAQVDLQTKDGDLLKRRIVGIEGGNLRLEGATTSLGLDNLGMINPPPKMEPSWTGSLKINALWTDGNTDNRAVGATIDAVRRAEIDRISFDANWDYADEKDNTFTATRGTRTLTQRRAGGGLKYDYFLNKKWYALATARVLGDTLADIKLRFSGGAGIGYTWVEDSTATFLTEVGLSYVSEDYRTATSPSIDYLAARIAYKLTYALSEHTKLVHGVEAFPSTERIEDTYLQAKTEITTSLTESMVASVAHVLDWDNTPAPGFERADNRVVLSVGWSF